MRHVCRISSNRYKHEKRFQNLWKPPTVLTVPPVDKTRHLSNFDTAIASQQAGGKMKRRGTALTVHSGSSSAGWIVIAARALLLLTGSGAFQLQPISPPGDAAAPFKAYNSHNGCCLARRPTSAVARAHRTVIGSASRAPAAGKDGEESFAEDKRYRRKPKGANLRRDAAGLPSEKVYAPRQSA